MANKFDENKKRPSDSSNNNGEKQFINENKKRPLTSSKNKE